MFFTLNLSFDVCEEIQMGKFVSSQSFLPPSSVLPVFFFLLFLVHRNSKNEIIHVLYHVYSDVFRTDFSLYLIMETEFKMFYLFVNVINISEFEI